MAGKGDDENIQTEKEAKEDEDKDTGNLSPSFENDGEDSTPKQEGEQEDETEIDSVFSYDQLKAKSDNPVTGIDFKRREVGLMEISL